LQSGNTTLRTIRASIFVSIVWVAICTAMTASITPPPGGLQKHEREAARALIRASQFVDVRHVNSRPSCEAVRPPEALTTPDPLFTLDTLGRRVKVSFIIGADGRVHAPLILESAGLIGDRRVLQTVRTWRYRPAMCNGVPTETEGKVEFSTP
jgi:TonB family protein